MKRSTLASVLSCLAGLAAAGSSSAQVLRDNGPFVTHPGAHVSGADVSLAQDQAYAGYTALGYRVDADARLVDDFTVPAGKIWTVTGVHVFAYQTGSDAPFTDGRVRIWKGRPNFGGTIVYDGSATNTLVSSTPGAYRMSQSASPTPPFTDTARRVQDILLSIPPQELLGGLYWVDWTLVGPTAGTTVFTPPISILGQPYTSLVGFSGQYRVAAANWVTPLSNSTAYLVDLPFVLNGTSFDDRIFIGGFETFVATP